jgi:hypothetical protein
MNNKSLCNPAAKIQRNGLWATVAAAFVLSVCVAVLNPSETRADAPAWMHALASASVPDHDEKTDAVLLYSEDILTVQPNGKMKRLKRRAYKILRVGGKDYGLAVAYFDAETKVLNMHGWCIPAAGKDFEVKEKDAIESSLPGVANGELVSDLRARILQIPASDPGNVVGYEIEQEERPFVFQDTWNFQTIIPVKESRFTLVLPPGWEYKSTWLNFAEVKPTGSGNQWQWVVNDVKPLRPELDMPPLRGLEGQMLISFLPPGQSDKKGFENWAEMGKWEGNLVQGRRDPSPELKQKVAELTAGKTTTLAKMQALAAFVQKDIRYVAIELGIGGLQPHPAKDIFSNHYGDCKDKATLLSAMLKEINVDSYYISLNATRGAVTAQTPAQMYWFNHEILAVRLPDDVKDDSLLAVYTHPALGRILIFDPTDELTPFGKLRGDLQADYGLLVTPEGGDLIQLPQLEPAASGVHRLGKLKLAADGSLTGQVVEVRLGDSAMQQRYALRTAKTDADMVKPLEALLAHSLSNFQITKASVLNQKESYLPFQYDYSFTAPNYAKVAGDLLLVRPHVIGHAASDVMETKEPRKFPIEFNGPEKDVATFEIALPQGYVVDDLPSPADVDYPFGSYHSKTVTEGNVLKYTRTYEIKQVSVPVSQADDLKKFFRIIGNDERSTAVLKPAGH